MDTQQQQKTIKKVADVKQSGEGKKLKQQEEGIREAGQTAKQQSPPSGTNTTASQPSPSSSPSHEFSFTISLHPSSTTTTRPDKAKAVPPPFAIDLSPADDIFFHGHLLPLHLLSHLPVSPRSSTNSMDSFTLPIRELFEDQKPNTSNSNCSSSSNNNNHHHRSNNNNNNSDHQTKGRSKQAKSFSLFGLSSWRKGCEVRDQREDKEKQKKKLRFDVVSHVLKRYVRMVRPFLFSRGRRENVQFRRQPYSFSGNLSLRNKQELRGRRGEFSAPASMRTSPTNSGLLVATATLPSSSTSDSTIEELQAAIQAAIAHCKNSIAVEEKLKC